MNVKLSEVVGLKKIELMPKENTWTDGYQSGHNKVVNDISKFEIDTLALAKELFEVCTYPSPDTWESEETLRDVWITRAALIADNMKMWIKVKQ